ncbi:glycosyltransferase [Pseudomonas sichuanensis]|uniref:dermonecrotic toxin domain-containing protein n=1 Tax=Pseudomonas sichuanensis TaxID=2213015 RepID=UPI002449BE44|nr:DUF6543 domain-containing protein [Pseudomonas sichuanensis]MDH0732113.1 glycosyltransferase [Pseudomonas sichuanensis]MDH1581625.1 glycosyltransferase [Pseudomonas sichuanensis]MDH1593589.1 glycosyltransferase [Pseudomonas sichuanensis]MDH1599426.1 glycosyltransferase [Pseudomonas sichuanensis]
MPDTPVNQPLVARLPDDLLDLDGLPTLACAARVLFNRACPGLLGQPLFLLQHASTETGQQIMAAHALESLIEQARRGEAHNRDVFDPRYVSLSIRGDSLAPTDLYHAKTLGDIRRALATITPAATLEQFEIDQTTYWEVPERLSLPSRRLGQAIRARESLDGHTGLLVEVGMLPRDAAQLIADIVRHPRWQDRVLARGVYRLGIQVCADDELIGVPGVLILTQQPGGLDPRLGYVTERQALTGETVVVCLGYLGFMQSHDSLEAAMAALRRRLVGNEGWFSTLLSCMPPRAQAALLAQRESAFDDLQLRVSPIDGDPFEALAQQQIDAWRLNALHDQGTLWRDRIGLDASRSKAVRGLLALDRQRQAARSMLLHGARAIAALQQDQLDTLLEQLQENQAVADRWFSTLPTFEAFASEKIRAELLAEGWDIEPEAVRLDIAMTYFRPDVEQSELAPGVVPDDRQVQSSNTTCTLLEYIAMRLDQRVDATWRVTLAEPAPANAEGLSLKVIGEVAERLDLQERYEQALGQRLRRPDDVESAELYDLSREAAEALFEVRLRIDALLAYSKGDLDHSGHQLVENVLANPRPAGAAVHGDGLGQMEAVMLNGNSMRDVYLFSILGESSIVCYTPGRPDGKAFERFTSRRAFRAMLTEQLAGIGANFEQIGELAGYWLKRFGKHQMASALPALILLAEGKGGSLLISAALGQSPGRAAFEHRRRFLLAEGDALAVSDSELALNNGLEVALAIFRALSLLVPGRIMTIFDLAEIGYFLFSAYASYSAGQRQAAGDYLIEALASVPAMVNAKGPRLQARGPAAAPMLTHVRSGQLTIDPIPATLPASNAIFRFNEGDRAGLYVDQRRLYVELEDGLRYPVHEVKDPVDGTLTRHLGPAQASEGRDAFSSPAPVILRDPTSNQWRVVPRLRLLGGGDHSRAVPEGAPHLMRGVVSRKINGVVEHYVREGANQRRVEFDLWTCRWYARELDRFLHYDEVLGYHVELPRPKAPASPFERERARQHFELPTHPTLPRLHDAGFAQSIPSHLHQVWIGSSASLIDAHAAVLDHNARLAKQSGYTLEVHFYKLSGLLPEALQLASLRRRFPEVVFSPLHDQAFFQAFRSSPVGRVFDHFLALKTRNLAAACDALRYRLIKELGGIYLDMDDRLSKPLHGLALAPGQLGLGGVVQHANLALLGFNNSHFASLRGNPLLDAIEREMVTRFEATRWSPQRPKLNEGGFWSYMRNISRVTGPRLLNDVYGAVNPRAEAMRYVAPYMADLKRISVIPEPNVQAWMDATRYEVAPLDDYFVIGTTGSWMTGRR